MFDHSELTFYQHSWSIAYSGALEILCSLYCVVASADRVTAPPSRPEDSSVASVSASASSSLSSVHTAAPPQLSKVTAFEFMQAWNGLKGTTDIEQYVSILDQIQPADIPKGVFDMPIVAPKFLCAFLQSITCTNSCWSYFKHKECMLYCLFINTDWFSLFFKHLIQFLY